MSGGTDIAILLANMNPTLSAFEVVFCSFPNASLTDKAFLDPICCFVEPEGLSLIISRQVAEAHGIPYSVVLQGITLNVHSSLEAVGLTAAVAGRLTRHGISANIVAAYYHDHVLSRSQMLNGRLRCCARFRRKPRLQAAAMASMSIRILGP